jgi:Ca-activated chloride channel homolog
MNISFAYPWILAIGILLLILAWWWRVFQKKEVVYQFPLTDAFARAHSASLRTSILYTWIRKVAQVLMLVALVIATARPRCPDERTKIAVEGIAIMMVLDVSGSMELFDDPSNPISRFAVAQNEAIKFINRRSNDMFGLTLFGAIAASRCPLTSDKKIVIDILKSTKLGVINPDGTMLSLSIAMGVNRLKNAETPSKIMVVLTDGQPSPEDIRPEQAITLAQKAGIKIYTIGIGSEKGGFAYHPFGGVVQVPTPLNHELLTMIAQKTGGTYFVASNAQELEDIYKQIDMLEKSSHQTPTYAHYHEYFVPLLLFACMILLIDTLCSCWLRVTL